MRVVVVGNGMVGARFTEELCARDPGAHVVVLGAEGYAPYNRVRLSEVVAGTVDLAGLTLPEAPAATVLRGVAARRIDRARKVVETDCGDVPYDVVVLATGADARIPPVPGLAPLPAGVHALRTLDDAREVVAATANARRAVVLGGGVLGLEVACGLVRRGLAVTLVHAGGRPMDRQLDDDAAGVVADGLERLGVRLLTGARLERVVTAGGRLRGVVVDGAEHAADLLVVTAGTVPASSLARDAGLEVRRGVVVDEHGRTADPDVCAIGDCAEPPGGATGLVAQGWAQARRLATHLAQRTGALPAAPGRTGDPSATDATDDAGGDLHGTDVVRLKAPGLAVVTMGRATPGARRLHLSDPAGGRHVAVLVDDGVLVGATCVGAPDVGADLTALYTRRTPVPRDPAHLLLRPVRGTAPSAEPSPTLMPDRATVCRCNGVTKGEIVACWSHGARSVDDVARATRATTGCGGCTDAVCGLVDWLRTVAPDGEDVEDRRGEDVDETVRPVRVRA